MMRALVAAALAVALAAPAQAAAADIFVGSSTPGASDGGACNTAAVPCATIQAGVDKSEAQGGGDVHVLPNPDGRTTDTYAEAVTLDGSAPVTLVGAGRWANGTLLAPYAATPLDLGPGTGARSLRVAAPAGGTAVMADADSILDDAVVEAAGGTAYDGSGRVEDSRLVGATGALLDGARLVRSRVVSTVNGIVARLGTSQLLQVAVLPRDQIPQGGGDRAATSYREVTEPTTSPITAPARTRSR
jgi:hypothetical protein